MPRTFDELIAEADSVSVAGSELFLARRQGHRRAAIMGIPTTAACSARERVASALDLYTGGGEVLAGAGPFPATMAATEPWPPNIGPATQLLHPLGVVVVVTGDQPPLPFADSAFDLVTSRHPSAVWWDEIARASNRGVPTLPSTSASSISGH